jgi:hypothetical protein
VTTQEVDLLQHELVGEDAQIRVGLDVADAGRDEVDAALVDQGDPRRLVDERPVDIGPPGCGHPGVRCSQRSGVENRAVDTPVAEVAVVGCSAAWALGDGTSRFARSRP